MKKIYALLGSAAMLIGASVAQAQDYQPVYPNHTHHFSDVAQDSIFSLKIDSVYTVGSDTVFRLNDMGRYDYLASVPACNTYGIYYWVDDNLLGQRMVKKQNGDYLFISSASDTFTLKTKVQAGQTWDFRNDGSITASITSRAIEPVLNQSDSVITYNLSNGKTIKLSKNFGFLKIHAFRGYYEPNTPQDEWQFFSLPEKGLGRATLNALTIYDYQIGDSLGWHNQNYLRSGTLCGESWLRKVILSKQVNATQDTVWYEVEKSYLLKTYGVGNPPAGMGCSGTTAVHPIVVDTVIEMYTRNSQNLENLTQNAMTEWFSVDRINKSIYKSNINNRYISKIDGQYFRFDSCSNSLKALPDAFTEYLFLEGVGIYQTNSSNIYDYSTNELEFYRKGTESYGNYSPLRVLASTKEPIFGSPMAAYPNPFAGELTLELDILKPGTADVTVFNQLGQRVYTEKMETVQGKQQLNLSLQNLPAGLYLLQLQKNGITESVKILKAN